MSAHWIRFRWRAAYSVSQRYVALSADRVGSSMVDPLTLRCHNIKTPPDVSPPGYGKTALSRSDLHDNARMHGHPGTQTSSGVLQMAHPYDLQAVAFSAYPTQYQSSRSFGTISSHIWIFNAQHHGDLCSVAAAQHCPLSLKCEASYDRLAKRCLHTSHATVGT